MKDIDKIVKNKFFTGNYDHLRTPRTEVEARQYALTRSWTLNDREYIGGYYEKLLRQN
jgi:hypothetical protein